MNRYEKEERSELVQATGEETYAKGKEKELHDHLVGVIGLVSNEALESYIALCECELRERLEAELDDLPF